MFRKIFTLAVLIALPLTALPQSEEQLVERYTKLAGSKQNATSLVTGLRDGKEVKLTSGATRETFVPKEKMGYGGIDNALALAQATLGKETATPRELEAVLMGGKVGSVTHEGILKMRYEDKMGWGLIAQRLGFKLGEVKRPERLERVSKAERPARPERPQRPEKPERPEKPR